MGPVDITPARAEPFVWSASYDGDAVLLAGFVPNDVVKESLVAAAKAAVPEATITRRPQSPRVSPTVLPGGKQRSPSAHSGGSGRAA